MTPGALLLARRARAEAQRRAMPPMSPTTRVPRPHKGRAVFKHQQHRNHRHPGSEMEPATVTHLNPPHSVEPVLDAADLRERIRNIATTDPVYTQSQIAREAGVSGATLSQWLAGTYAGNNANVGRKVQQWLAGYDARQSASGLPAAPAWVPTPTSERVIDALRYAQIANDVVVIYGGAGVGKSTAIERYRNISSNVWVVEMSRADSSVLTSLQAIAEAVGIKDFAHSAAFLKRAILARIKGTNGLLVIDEAQHLGELSLDMIRHFNDKAHIGLVLCGNEHVYGRMAGGSRAVYLDRLFSRIGKRIHIKRSTDEDADLLVRAWGIEDAACKAQIHEIASRPGALRVLTKVLRLAATYAQAGGRKLCCTDINAAWRELAGAD